MSASTNELQPIEILTLPVPEVPGRNPTRFIVLTRDPANPPRIEVPRGFFAGPGDQIQLRINGNDVGPIIVAPDEDDGVTPITVLIPPEFFPDDENNTYQVGYWTEEFIAGTRDFSLNVEVRLDREAPGGDPLGDIQFTPDQLSGISEADFTAGVMQLRIPAHVGKEFDDTLQLGVLTDPNDPATVVWLPEQTVTAGNRTATLYNVQQADLLALGDGPRAFVYRVFDLSRNESVLSRATTINVTLQGPTLDVPRVPEYLNDGLITGPEANPTVRVEIPPYLTGAAQVGDTIRLFWGAEEVTPAQVVQDINLDPLLAFEVPLAIVRQVGNGPVVVRYVMQRAGSALPLPEAQTTVQVNLSTPGGEDPNPGDPVHGNLLALNVRGNSNELNRITAFDFAGRFPATATIPRFGADGNVIWQLDDVVQVFWQTDTPPLIGSVQIVAGNIGNDLPVTIPFDGFIELTGPGVFNVWYTVTRQLTSPDNPNPIDVVSTSPVQSVTVLSAAQLPGGGVPLPAVVFPRADARNIVTPLNTGTPTAPVYERDTVFRIMLRNADGSPVLNIGAGDTLEYRFAGHIQARPRPADLPIRNTPPVPLPDDIAQTTLPPAARPAMVSVLLTQQHINQGFVEVPLPFARLTDRICANGASVSYRLTNGAGPEVGPAGYTYFALNIAGATCPITP